MGKPVFIYDEGGLDADLVCALAGIDPASLPSVTIVGSMAVDAGNVIEGEYQVNNTAVPLPYSTTLEQK